MSTGAFSEAEFGEMMAPEANVDMERLREAARLGCPTSMRGHVWKYLLGVSHPDRNEEAATRRRLQAEFMRMQQEEARAPPLAPDLLRRLRAEIRRRIGRSRRPSPLRNTAVASGDSDAAGDAASSSSDCDSDEMERLIVLYLANNRSCEFEESALYLLTPFMSVLSDPCDIYFCFSTLREYIDTIESFSIENQLAKFMMLFRTFEGELCTHFEDEELRPNEWAIPWLRNLLSKELPLPCLLRLWDTYFADSADSIELHMFLCLAILGACKEALIECEYSELKGFLWHLPDMDMDQILVQASNLQKQVAAAWSTVSDT